MKVVVDGVEYAPIPQMIEGCDELEAALELRFDSDAGMDITIRDYLRILLEKLWLEKDSFSSKHPFGNSDWERDIYKPLVVAGLIKGEIDDWGSVYVDRDHRDDADAYVQKLIRAALKGA